MTLADIQKQLEECRAKAEGFLKDMEVEGLADARKEELNQSYEAAMSEFDELREKGDKLLKLRGIDDAIERYAGGKKKDPDSPLSDVRNDDSNGSGDTSDEMTYEQAFVEAIRSTEGNNRMTPEIRAALARGYVPAGETRDQATGTGGAGGYLIPEGFMAEISKALKLWGPMEDASLVRQVVTDSGNDIPWPIVDDTGNTGDDTAENTAITVDDIAFTSVTLKAYNRDSGLVLVPWQLLEDSGIDLTSTIGELIGERLARRINSDLTVGTGTNQPQGITVGAAVGKDNVSKAADLSGVVTFQNVYDLYHSVDPLYRMRPDCAWQANDAILQVLRKVTFGGASDTRPLWQMGDVTKGEPDMILGKPVYTNNAMADSGGARKILMAFGAHKYYVYRKVRTMNMVTLRERYADKRQNGYFAWCRIDGRILQPNAIKTIRTAA